jgi:hypothetical protein
MAGLFGQVGSNKLFQGVDPNAQYDPNAALGQLQSMLGFDLTPDQIAEAGTIANWDGNGQVAGVGLNKVFQEAAARTGGKYVDWSSGGEQPPIAPPPPPIDPGGIGRPVPSGPIINPPGPGAPVDPLRIETAPNAPQPPPRELPPLSPMPSIPGAPAGPIDPGGIGRPVDSGFQGVDPSLAFAPEEAIALLESMVGRSLTPDEIAEAQTIAQYSSGQLSGEDLNRVIQEAAARSGQAYVPFGGGGGSPTPTPGPGSPAPGPTNPNPPGTFTGVDPASSFEPSAALAELERQIGRSLTPQEYQDALGLLTQAGYSGSGPISGELFNLLLQEATGRTPGATFVPWGGTAGPGPEGPGPEGPGPEGPGNRDPSPGEIPGDPGYGEGPFENVGDDPLSIDLTARLRDLLKYEGTTQFGEDMNGVLRTIIANGGAMPDNVANAQFESARELMAKGERTMTNDLRGALADRNLLSEPGIAQGAEIGGQGRITQQVSEEFARALRDIGTASGERADARLSTALQLASGMSQAQATTMLQAIGAGTERQAVLSEVALKTLAQNQSWAEFLAEFGLERDQALYDMESGNIAQYLPLLNLFTQLTQLSTRGYI